MNLMKVKVTVHPNSRKPRIETQPNGQIDVYVSQLPIEGKANQAVIKALAQHFSLSKNKVSLLSGETQKSKLFEIDI